MKKPAAILALLALALLLAPLPFSFVGQSPLANALPSRKSDEPTVQVLMGEEIASLPLRDYLCGTVAAEMPATYGLEALKAQAVAVCSYMVYRLESARENPSATPEHRGAAVCIDPSHCKAFLSPEQARKAWGEDGYSLYYPKITAAVDAVAGEILTYDQKPVNAVFHELSAGRTESAGDVWGVDVPYLVAVDSPADAAAENARATLSLSREELFDLLAILDPELDPALPIGEARRTASGGVLRQSIGGKSFTGAVLRSTLSLPSTHFTLEEKDGTYTFTTLGRGHCVGMSQYGAGALAAEGKTYREILQAYYTGVEISRYSF